MEPVRFAAHDPGNPGRVPDGTKRGRSRRALAGVRPSASARGSRESGPGPASFFSGAVCDLEVCSDGVVPPVCDASAWMAYPTRLETRTKESNMRASRWVGNFR